MKIKWLIFITLIMAIFIIGYMGCEVTMTDKSGLDEESVTELGASVGTVWNSPSKLGDLCQGKNGQNDFLEISDPNVIYNGNKYLMWYSGKNAEGLWRICFATSYDGISWTKDLNNSPVLCETKDALDCDGVRVNTVIYDSYASEYKMWYSGFKKNATGANYTCNLFYATSKYSNKEWHKYPNDDYLQSVFFLTDEYNNGVHELSKVFVIQRKYNTGIIENDDSELTFDYQMLFVQNVGGSTYIPKIFFAYSPTEVDFQNIYDKNPSTVNVLYKSTSSIILNGYCMPTVLKDYYNGKEVYKLWFAAKNDGGSRKVGFAVTKVLTAAYFDTPMDTQVFSSGTINADKDDLRNPCVIRSGNKYKMWYGAKVDTSYCICYTETSN